MSVSTLALATIDAFNRLAFAVTPILAQADEEEAENSYSIEVALVMLCVVLGLLVALRPSKRTVEFKKPDEQ